MPRRRRTPKEIPFSFDSFLDVVANVVGIIIRLILVAWIGARGYKAVVAIPPPPEPPPAVAELPELPDPTDPRLDQIARRRVEASREAASASQARREQERELSDESERLRRSIAEVVSKRQLLQEEQSEHASKADQSGKAAKGLLLSAEELRTRSEKLAAELKKAEEKPKETKKLRYRTPVSAVVQTEEVMFECKNGRVTLLDTASLLDQIRKAIRSKGESLRDRWETSDVTTPVGAFRLRYVIEREKSALDGPGGVPVERTYRYGLSGWEAESIDNERGENEVKALASGSAFRKVADDLDPQQTVVTFWVYPDSFALYRRLRDYLHGKEVVVAGRPLPDGVPIASSRKGTASRGQ